MYRQVAQRELTGICGDVSLAETNLFQAAGFSAGRFAPIIGVDHGSKTAPKRRGEEDVLPPGAVQRHP